MNIAPIIIVAIVILAVGVVWASVKTIDQAHVGVVTLFGKYRRTLNPGLNFVIPLAEKVHWKVPVQNQTSQLQFAAITNDQASVHFTATIIFAVTDHQPETIQLVAFKFINYDAFNIAMTSAVEASVREFVATKKQADVLGLRTEIASHAKETLNQQLGEYGYTLLDLAINDITFDPEVMASMSRVVAATNSQTAAEFEGKALLIKRTKEAEANGAFIRIGAENEAAAAKLRGQGLADFRTELSKGLAASAEELERAGISPGMLALNLWTEAILDTAKMGKGNVLFIDGNIGTLESNLRRLEGLVRATPQEMEALANLVDGPDVDPGAVDPGGDDPSANVAGGAA